MEEMSIRDVPGHLDRGPALSDWFAISQSLVDAFADVTGDRQFIHTDPARAVAEGPFGGTVAHGLLTLSLLPAMAKQALPPIGNVRSSVNYGFDRVRFVAPVRVGARIRGRFGLHSLAPRGADAVMMTWDVTVEIERSERPALLATWLGLRYLAAA